jgi:AraC-like DNA-binding protein
MVALLARHPLTRDCYPTALGYYPRALGHRMARSRHDDNLLVYCVDGRGDLAAGGHNYRVAGGDLMLLPQGLEHRYTADPDHPWTLYWAHFQGVSTRVFVDYLGYREGRAVVHAGLAPALIGGFNSLLSVRRTGYSADAFILAANQLRHLLSQFALEISRGHGGGKASLDLEALRAYMEENIHRQLDLEALAAVAHLSKYHFSARYKAATGYSPIQHFLHMKVEYACQLLDSTELSVKAVAAELGYDDALYFSRLFSRVMGESPRAYRRAAGR